MATHQSTQRTNLQANPQVKNRADEWYGRVRVFFFDFTVPAGDAAVNDLVQLLTIPANFRLLAGQLAHEAMTTGGANASIQIGDGTTADKYLTTANIDGIGVKDFLDTLAHNMGERLSAELTLTAKVLTEDWAAAKIIKGYVLAVKD